MLGGGQLVRGLAGKDDGKAFPRVFCPSWHGGMKCVPVVLVCKVGVKVSWKDALQGTEGCPIEPVGEAVQVCKGLGGLKKKIRVKKNNIK